MRFQRQLNKPDEIRLPENLGTMTPVVEEEVRHCATVIAAAFFNPSKL
jgi:hypothetical protein